MERMLLVGCALLVAACGSTYQVPEGASVGNDAGAEAATVAPALTVFACDASEVKVDSVTPSQICPGSQTPVTITGSGFMATPAVFLRRPDNTLTQAPSVTFQSDTTLTAVLQTQNLDGLNDDLIVVNPDGCTAVLPGAEFIWCEGPAP